MMQQIRSAPERTRSSSPAAPDEPTGSGYPRTKQGGFGPCPVAVAGHNNGDMTPENTDQARKAGEADIITQENLKELAATPGPCLSAFMPTHRSGPETLQGSIRLGNLITEAEAELEATGMDKKGRGELLAPLRELVDDDPFWQDQADGLALFVAPGSFSRFRLALDLPEEVTVSRHFRLRPLLPAVGGKGTCLLLAITTNTVRLYETGHHTITELDLGPIPGSMDEALKHEDPESQLQSHRHGDTTATGFHGHGEGKEVRKEELERFMRAVDRGLQERVGNSGKPLILACVSYYEPIYRSVSSYPTIVDEILEGSPERVKAEELHARALDIIESREGATNEQVVEKYHEQAGTGRTASSIDEIVELASQGRVDTLLVAADAPEHWVSDVQDDAATAVNGEREQPGYDKVDLAVKDTIGHGGDVLIVDNALDNGERIAAILRY